jgi:hypothetical protein
MAPGDGFLADELNGGITELYAVFLSRGKEELNSALASLVLAYLIYKQR